LWRSGREAAFIPFVFIDSMTNEEAGRRGSMSTIAM
jgi:hypothetical protein